MAFIRPFQDFDRDHIDAKIFIGKVVDNNDPNKEFKVKVRVVDIWGNPESDIHFVEDGDLPWCAQLRAPMFGSSQDIGFFSLPVIDSYVVVIFPGNDTHNPFYIGDLVFNGVTQSDVTGDNYPNIWGWQDPQGNKWILDRVDNTLTFLLNGSYNEHITVDMVQNIDGTLTATIGGDATMTFQANLTATVTGNLTATVQGNVALTATGTVTITSASNVTVSAPSINIDATSGTSTITSSGAVTILAPSVLIP